MNRADAVRYVAEHFPPAAIVRGMKEAIQRPATDSLDIGSALSIIVGRASVLDDRYIQYTGAISLVPAILRELIRNDIKFHGAEIVFSADAHSDGACCDYLDMAREMIQEPSLVPKVNDVNAIERKLVELRQLIGALSRAEAHQLAFQRENGTPAWDAMVCAIRYPNSSRYMPHTDDEENQHLYS